MRWSAIDRSPENISCGYLLELVTDLHDATYCSDRGQGILLRTPEYPTRAETEHIADLFRRAEDALYSPNGENALGEPYAELYDIDTLVDLYILQEFSMNQEASGTGSTFFYQPTAEDMLYAGPVWDLTGTWSSPLLNFGRPDGDHTVWQTNALSSILTIRSDDGDVMFQSIPSFLSAAYMHEELRRAVCSRWSELSECIRQVVPNTEALWEKLASAVYMNAARWQQDQAGSLADHIRNINGAYAALATTIRERTAALDKGFAPDAAMLYYDANGGEGVMFHTQILSVGETAKLNEAAPSSTAQTVLISEASRTIFETLSISVECLITPPSEGYVFTGWNTEPDGSGDTYQPGDEYTVTQKTNVLYAQWEKE